jgi:outer membrane protein OmpA-like peptidoglycan-associated protein
MMYSRSTLFISAVSLLFCGFPLETAQSQEVSTEDIVKTLKPKKLTRTLKKDPSAAEMDAVLSRSIGVVERKKIVEITEKAALPKLDFTISFGFDSAEIDNVSFATLDALATALKSNELYNSRFLINGHTDAKGAEDYNLELSQRRANAVVAYLASQHQIEAQRLTAIGFGESALKDAADGEAASNRRVEIINRP